MDNFTCPINFECIYEQFYRKVYNYVYARLLDHEAAEDVTQEIFWLVLKKLHLFDAKRGSLTTWLITIANHATTDYLRRACVRREEPIGQLIEYDVAAGLVTQDLTEKGTLQNPANLRTYRILRALTDSERNLLSLRYEIGLNNEEIADMEGSNATAISQRFHRLLVKCRKIDSAEQA